MSEHITDTPFDCGNQAALIAYLYDECEPVEREVIAAHLAGCLVCSDDLESLRATRRMLPAWTPPASALGFRITGDEAPAAAVLRPARWWQRPLPAWAQAAAAAAIFAAGLSMGQTRAPAPTADGQPRAASASDAGSVPAAPAAGVPVPAPVGVTASGAAPEVGSVSREDLDRLERDLRGELARLAQAQRAAARVEPRTYVAAAGDADAGEPLTMQRVQALVQESERRQRRALIEGMAQVLIDVDAQRRRDLAPMQQTVERLRGEALTNRDSVAALVNLVSTQSGYRPVSGR